MQNAEMEQILALMNQYAAVLITLNERGVIRTYNSPVGDFAEWLVSQKLGLRLEKNSARGLDATGSDGLRYQIKCRWERTDFPTPQSRELGVIRSLEKNQFDFLIAVIFDSHFQVPGGLSDPARDHPPVCGLPPPCQWPYPAGGWSHPAGSRHKGYHPPAAVSGMHLHRESSRFSPCTARGFLLYYGQKGQRP